MADWSGDVIANFDGAKCSKEAEALIIRNIVELADKYHLRIGVKGNVVIDHMFF